jgi:hypothetical protein
MNLTRQRCGRCYGGGQISLVPSEASAAKGHQYDLRACPVCSGSGEVTRRRRPPVGQGKPAEVRKANGGGVALFGAEVQR